MSRTDTTIRTLTKAMLWDDVRSQGWRLLAFPVAIGLAFLGYNIAMSQMPGVFTGATVDSLERFSERYFGGIEDDQSLFLAALLVQGPYFLGLLASLLAVVATTNGAGERVRRGELELLLSAPYSPRQVFLALISSSLLVTLGEVLVLSVITLGGVTATLLLMDVTLQSSVVELASLAFLTPLPLALWATLVAVFAQLRYPGVSLYGMGVDNPLILVALGPAILLLLVMISFRGFDPILGALAALVVPTVGVLVGIATIDRWFNPRRVIGL